MNTLIIETSTSVEFISVRTDEKIFCFSRDVGRSHSTDLFFNIKSVLDSAGISLSDIGLIGAGTGPGSFTGVRIAVTTARMLAQILSVPLTGIKSHEIYAVSAGAEPGDALLVAFDAKKGRVFAALYLTEEDRSLSVIADTGDYEMSFLAEKVPEGARLICIGDGCGKYLDILTHSAGERGFTINYHDNFLPSGEKPAELAESRYKESPEKYKDWNLTVPFYGRKSDAETAMEKKRQAGN